MMKNPSPPIFLADEDATAVFAAALAKDLSAPLTLWLEGGLGAGKTTFARCLLRALGYGGTVKSPTYAIVESYALPQFALHHFDLYRFAAPEEWADAGLDDLAGLAVLLIEWPQKGGGFTPPADLALSLTRLDGGRQAVVTAYSPTGQESLTKWINNLPAAK
ncbi:MAG: tRNA (adenosine(37)-N6)-threonylcarbamoyltransferase complex ATPase subunit type 1 TsaE [Neisseria sp.]|nr:tRNA (adenosine(37)-N6)-threonylcarbamoyltransferase complex ATPase subunit type 1 TsaE [Neisseria sp.]